jgi:monothiol glutaredoxin
MCHRGGRSRRVAQYLAAIGFESVFNLKGGIDAWSLEIDPDVPRFLPSNER